MALIWKWDVIEKLERFGKGLGNFQLVTNNDSRKLAIFVSNLQVKIMENQLNTSGMINSIFFSIASQIWRL